MTRVVIDTNVVISGLLQKNAPYHVTRNVLRNPGFIWCLSLPVFEKYKRVLSREKFTKDPKFSSEAFSLLLDVQLLANWYTPRENIQLLEDDADNRFLELAVDADAKYLITGNHRDFSFDAYRGTLIVSPSKFLEITS